MAKLAIKPGSTSVSLYVLIQDSSSLTGAGLAGLAYWSSGLSCYYVRTRGSATQIILVGSITPTSAWLESGFTAVDDTNMPGIYRLDIPNAVCAAGARSAVIVLKGATNMAPVVLEIDLSSDANVTMVNGEAINNLVDGNVPVNVTSWDGGPVPRIDRLTCWHKDA